MSHGKRIALDVACVLVLALILTGLYRVADSWVQSRVSQGIVSYHEQVIKPMIKTPAPAPAKP